MLARQRTRRWPACHDGMNEALPVLLLLFALLLAVWPLAWLGAMLPHALARRWRRVGELALLIPLWSVAATIALAQLAPWYAARDIGQATAEAPPVGAALGLAAGCAAAAWWLLLRSFRTGRG